MYIASYAVFNNAQIRSSGRSVTSLPADAHAVPDAVYMFWSQPDKSLRKQLQNQKETAQYVTIIITVGVEIKSFSQHWSPVMKIINVTSLSTVLL